MTALAAQSICDDDNKLDFSNFTIWILSCLKGHTKKFLKKQIMIQNKHLSVFIF